MTAALAFASAACFIALAKLAVFLGTVGLALVIRFFAKLCDDFVGSEFRLIPPTASRRAPPSKMPRVATSSPKPSEKTQTH